MAPANSSRYSVETRGFPSRRSYQGAGRNTVHERSDPRTSSSALPLESRNGTGSPGRAPAALMKTSRSIPQTEAEWRTLAVACTCASSKVIPRRGCSFHAPARCTFADIRRDPPFRPRAHEKAGEETVPDQRPADVPAEEAGAPRDEDLVILHECAVHDRDSAPFSLISDDSEP